MSTIHVVTWLSRKSWLLAIGIATFGCARDAGAPKPELVDGSTPDAADGDVGCTRNSDCVGSPAERRAKELKCRAAEVYCSDNICVADCSKPCTVVRSDQNPCNSGTCTKVPGNADTFCSMLPVKCSTDSASTDCPAFRPLIDDAGLQENWACVDGICAYPGFQYPSR